MGLVRFVATIYKMLCCYGMTIGIGISMGSNGVSDILDCLKYIFHGVCGLVSIYYMSLGNFGYSFVGKRVVMRCVGHFLLVLLGFRGRFESPLVSLSVCH